MKKTIVKDVVVCDVCIKRKTKHQGIASHTCNICGRDVCAFHDHMKFELTSENAIHLVLLKMKKLSNRYHVHVCDICMKEARIEVTNFKQRMWRKYRKVEK